MANTFLLPASRLFTRLYRIESPLRPAHPARQWWSKSSGAVRLDLEILLLLLMASAALMATVLYVQGIGGLDQLSQAVAGQAEPGQVAVRQPSQSPGTDLREAVTARLAPVLQRTGLIPPAGAERRPSAPPRLSVISPREGETLDSTTVTVAFQVSGLTLLSPDAASAETASDEGPGGPGAGIVRLTLDALPSVILDRAEPYTFTAVSPGDHLLTVELLNADYSPLSPPVLRDIAFRTGGSPPLLPVAGLASPPHVGGLPVLLVAAGLLALGAAATLRRKVARGS